jgi:hypothetical protein
MAEFLDHQHGQGRGHPPLAGEDGGANQSVALDEPNKRLFVGCRTNPAVVVMDTETGKEITKVAIPAGIDDLFFDAQRKRLYAACAEGFLAVIRQVDADRYEALEKIATVADAKTAFYDPDTSKLYLAVPLQPGKKGPEIRVYQAN